MVNVSGRIHSISPAVAASGEFFQLPSGFYGGDKIVYMSGYMNIDGVMQSVLARLNDQTGKVQLVYTSSKTTNQVAFSGCFVLW